MDFEAGVVDHCRWGWRYAYEETLWVVSASSSLNVSLSARSPLCGQMVRAYMMIAVLLSLINMHKLQLILPGLCIEIGVRVNKVDQVLIEGHYLGKLGLWYHDAIMSEFMNIARSVFKSEEPSQTRFAVGEINLLLLDVVGQLRHQLLPMNETHGEADGILQCHFASATRTHTVHHARHRAL